LEVGLRAKHPNKFRDKMKPVIDKYAELVGPGIPKAMQPELAKLR
jgi:hypothetical protein